MSFETRGIEQGLPVRYVAMHPSLVGKCWPFTESRPRLRTENSRTLFWEGSVSHPKNPQPYAFTLRRPPGVDLLPFFAIARGIFLMFFAHRSLTAESCGAAVSYAVLSSLKRQGTVSKRLHGQKMLLAYRPARLVVILSLVFEKGFSNALDLKRYLTFCLGVPRVALSCCVFSRGPRRPATATPACRKACGAKTCGDAPQSVALYNLCSEMSQCGETLACM